MVVKHGDESHGKKWTITLNESKRIVRDCAMVYLPPITIIYHKNPPNDLYG